LICGVRRDDVLRVWGSGRVRRLALAELVFLHTDEFNYGLDNPFAGLMSANMSLRQRVFVAASSS
jgi:hypothetical protein